MKILITEEQIRAKVSKMARTISEKYRNRELLVLIVLKGAFVFAADLLRKLDGVDVRCDFIKASSYGLSTESSGKVKIELIPSLEIGGKDVLIVDDILDTGLTISEIKKWVEEKGARSCEVCVFLDKPERRKVPFEADYVGFKIPNHFVVGYGMDCGEKHRHYPFVAVLE